MPRGPSDHGDRDVGVENDTEGDAPEGQLRDVRHPSTADDDPVDSVLADVVEDFMDRVSDQGLRRDVDAGLLGSRFGVREAEYVNIPREEWGVGMSEKTVSTGLCPGGRLRLQRLLRLLETDRVDPMHMTTNRFPFGETDKPFRLVESKEDDIIEPLIESE